jgi:uncharacterized protein YjeT (DUF2065 family)
MTNDFDMSAFLSGLDNMSDEQRAKLVSEGVAEHLDEVSSSLYPKLWAVIQQEMLKQPDNLMRQNAVLNAAQNAVAMWLAACTESGQDDEIIRTSGANMKVALENAREHRKLIAQTAGSIGRMMLMEDTAKGLAGALAANTMVLKKLTGQ